LSIGTFKYTLLTTWVTLRRMITNDESRKTYNKAVMTYFKAVSEYIWRD